MEDALRHSRDELESRVRERTAELTQANDARLELLRLDESGIRVAASLTELPPRDVLQRKLHDAVRSARARFGALSD